ncbi:MAG: glycosyltransferase family 2 protein [Chloroflexi bacterium]|nr:glycosyltransferase family 2 protein [Chloroflexota bacterium]
MDLDRRPPPEISVVVPLYDEEDVLPALYARTTQALVGTESYEIVFVNDGSRDNTLSLLKERAAGDARVLVLNLSRNFGHQAALTAGLDAARGEAVVLMDGDLQDPPEIIPQLIAEWSRGAEVVEAQRRSRQDPGLRGFMFRLFHRWFGFVSDFPIQAEVGTFCLLDRRAADAVVGLQERNRFLPGLRSWVGFSRATVYYDRAARAGGKPKQSLRRLFRYAFDALFSFSYKPLRISWLLGSIVSIFAFTYAAALVVLRLLQINVVTGFTTPTVAILFVGGVQLLAIGILGEYLGRIYDEVKRRPQYIVAERIGVPEGSAARPSDSGSDEPSASLRSGPGASAP